MALFPMDEILLAHTKRTLSAIVQEVKSSHLAEAMAYGFGYATNSAMRAAFNSSTTRPSILMFKPEELLCRIEELADAHMAERFDAIDRLFRRRAVAAGSLGFDAGSLVTLLEEHCVKPLEIALFIAVLFDSENIDSGPLLRSARIDHLALAMRKVPGWSAEPDEDEYEAIEHHVMSLARVTLMSQWSSEGSMRFASFSMFSDVRINADSDEVSFAINPNAYRQLLAV